jgi:hypothetical protein
MPYFRVNEKSIYDQLREPKFHLLTFSDGGSASSGPATSKNYSAFVNEFTIPLYPHIAEIFGTNKSFQLLLRPDNYLAFITADMSPNRLENYLRKKVSDKL